MNILVINLTRFGDLLQTQSVLHGLKAQGHRVGLLCLENFAPAAALLDGVDTVLPLPGGALLARLDEDWRLALHGLSGLLDTWQRDFPAQGVVNTTATLGARLLARRLAPPDAPVLGFGLDQDGFGVSGDIWATFLQAATAQRLNCPFNIVDMFRMMAGVGDIPACGRLRAPGAEVLAEADRRLAAAPPDCAGFVAFQLGASEARRQWPVERFAALGDALWRELRLCPLLLGAPSERALAAAYAQVAEVPFVDCIGSTSIPQLAALLLRSRLLVTNDTGTMHLAAGQGVPVLAMFLATAQVWDTGPYLPGCCCLEPALDCHPCAFHTSCTRELGCLRRISPELLLELIRGHVQNGAWSAPGQSDVRIWLTTRDEQGFADVRGISGHEDEERTAWLRLQRYFYRHILDNLNGKPSFLDLPDAAAAKALSPEFRDRTAIVLRQAGELLHLMGEQGMLLRRAPNPAAGQRLLATCTRIHGLLAQCPPLTALGHLWMVLSQERGDDLETILRLAEVLRADLGAWQDTLERAVPGASA